MKKFTREATDEEIQKDYEEFCIAFGTENVKYMYSPIELVKIDYSDDENYVTFEEYKNETRVVSEAVEATYDEEGLELIAKEIDIFQKRLDDKIVEMLLIK